MLLLILVLTVEFFNLFTIKTYKPVMNYFAYLKVEVTKVADTQKEILELLSNNSQAPLPHISDDQVDYFIMNWPIS